MSLGFQTDLWRDAATCCPGIHESSMNQIRYTYCDGLLGRMLLVADEHGLRSINFPGSKRAERPQLEWREDRRGFTEATRQLRAYFVGELTDFDLPLALRGTEFQLRVWQSLRGIAYGDTISYGQLAARLGNPKASRAVGLANGSNPIPIVIPCHRVIGSNGSLVGYGGGLENKKALLALESRQRSLISSP
jgi:methylated-DNA-[protein]-cysteine S-methyltransferase